MPKNTPTAPVTKRALIARLRRKLGKEAEDLHATREGTRARQELGEFYVVDSRNWIRGGGTLEELAREHDVLQPWERLSDD